MADFNLADGSVAVVVKDGSPVTLIKGYQPNTWFYAPRAPRIARDARERPIFTIVRSRRRLAGGQGLETVGGTFAAQLDLTVPVLTDQERKDLTEFIIAASGIRPDVGNSFTFQPLQLRDGSMSVLGVDPYVSNPATLSNIRVGASSTIGVALNLTGSSNGTPGGADVFQSALRNSNSSVILPLLLSLTFEYDMVLPSCHYKLEANNRLVYDFFSGSYKDKFSYYGLVGGQSDLSFTRSELIRTGAIKITQISRPDGFNNERIKQLEASLIDVFTKNILAQIANKPHVDPAAAPDPKGFFGGVSLSLKSYTEIEALTLSAEYQFQEIIKVPYAMSYVFGPQFQQLNPGEYVLDVTTDNQLPIVIPIGGDPRVLKFSGQYGYRRSDGVFISNAIPDMPGEKGGVLTGVVQFGQGDPMPEEVEVQYTVDWLNPDWEDRKETVTEKVNASGAAVKPWSPGNKIGKIIIANDFERFEDSTFSSISWQTQFDDSTAKIYSGGSFILGQGAAGRIQSETIDFPYVGDQSKAKILIDVTVQKTDGTTLNKRLEYPITTSRIIISRNIMTQPMPLMLGGLAEEELSVTQDHSNIDEWLEAFESYADLSVNNYQKFLYSSIKNARE
jgi:hypothetical protein